MKPQDKLDAHESMFFARELEKIKARSFDIIFPEIKTRQLLPVVFDAGEGTETITYRQFEATGIAKIVNSFAKDFPRADVVGREFTSRVKSLGASFGYSLQDIRSSRQANKSLELRRANAARLNIMQRERDIAYFGDVDHGIEGFLTNPNITTGTVVDPGGGTEWVNKTPDQIIRDMNDIANGIVDLTKGVESPDTLLLPIAQHSLVASTPRSTTSDTTILEFFLRNNPFINNVVMVNELAAANNTEFADDNMVAYRRSPDKLTLEIPVDFEQFAPQMKMLDFEIPVHERIGGVIIYYPLSISRFDGI